MEFVHQKHSIFERLGSRLRNLLFLLVLGLTLGACSNLLYYPNQIEYSTKNNWVGRIEEVWFASENGARLHAWYLKSATSRKAKGIVVQLHGNAQNITSHVFGLEWLTHHGFDLFIFDYQGYGKSAGSPSPKKTLEDARAAIRKVHEVYASLPLIVFGQSLGGHLALRAVAELRSEIPIKLLVVEGTFASYQKVGAKVLSKSWLTWLFQPIAYILLSDEYSAWKYISSVSPVPLVVIHGTRDFTVDYDLGKEVFNRANEPKEFWSVENGIHMSTFFAQGMEFRPRLLKRLNDELKNGKLSRRPSP